MRPSGFGRRGFHIDNGLYSSYNIPKKKGCDDPLQRLQQIICTEDGSCAAVNS